MASRSSDRKPRLSAEQASQIIQSWIENEKSDSDEENDFSSTDDNSDLEFVCSDRSTDSENDVALAESKRAFPIAITGATSSRRGRGEIRGKGKRPIENREDRSRSHVSRPATIDIDIHSQSQVTIDVRSKATGSTEEVRWSEIDDGSTENVFRFVPPQLRIPGVNSDVVPVNSSPLFCLKALFTEKIMEELIVSINDYADKLCESKMTTASARSIYHRWYPITIPELYQFFSIIIAMGIIKKPKVSDYWSLESYMHTPWFKQIMKRERFQVLYHTMFHVCDIDASGKAKIEPFMQKLLKNYQEAYYPFKDLSLDEMVIGWKGRWAHKMFNASKPKKYHVKTFGLCDSRTSYVFNILIYFGANTSYSPELDVDSQQATKVFDTLLKPCGKGHHIYADRYYTSFQLLQYLTANSHYYTGTVNVNRKFFPKELKTTQLRHLQMKWFMDQEKRFLCVLFRDKKAKKPCVLVSSSASVATKEITNRAGTTNNKPVMIDHYNHQMNGCDKVDQCVTTYGTFNRRTRKWWKKIFYWAFEITQWNSFVLFALTRQENEKKQSLLQFKNQLINELSLAAAAAVAVDHQTLPPTIRESPVPGRPKHIIKKSKFQRVCVVCSTPQARVRTTFYCEGCTDHPFMHPNNCFAQFHTKN